MEAICFEAACAVGDGLLLQIDAELSLSMLLLCEDADRERTVAQMEVWMQTPWKLEGDR